MSTQYYFRAVAPRRVEIAKFEDSRYPVDVYHITNGQCDCPSWRHPCKHIAMLSEWLQQEQPEGTILESVGNRFMSTPYGQPLERTLHNYLETLSSEEPKPCNRSQHATKSRGTSRSAIRRGRKRSRRAACSDCG